jgi:hypothetical protein
MRRDNGSLPGVFVQLLVLAAVFGLYVVIVTRGRPLDWLP